MSLALYPPSHLQVLGLLFRREATARMNSPWFYAVASLVCLVAWFHGTGFQQAFTTESVVVSSDPLMALHVIVVVFLALVLGLRLAAGLAWEREHRTLEVLLVGPVSSDTIVLAKFLVELCELIGLMSIYLLYLLVAQPLGVGVIGLQDLGSAASMPLYALPVLTFGVLIAAWSPTVRGAVVTYLVAICLLATFEVVLGLLSARPPAELTLAASYLRNGMQALALLLDPVSPVSRLADLVRGVPQEILPTSARLWTALAQALGTLVLACLAARGRGAVT